MGQGDPQGQPQALVLMQARRRYSLGLLYPFPVIRRFRPKAIIEARQAGR